MAFFERALEERGIPNYVVGGRGYWSQQQVADLRHWLAALANPLDELAIYSVLASPLVGASLDALALARLHARRTRRDVWWALSEELPPDLAAEDRPRLERFVEIFSEERRVAPSVSLETLIDRVVTRTGYDRRVLAMPAGDRRMANVRKLMRVAREYEAGEGRDLRGFIDFVAERDMIQEREGEAPLEAEHLDAVRIMTVHRAKGLEFPVVCVADLGKSGREDYGALRVSDDGKLGLRLATLGGASVDSAAMKEMRERQRVRDEEEEQRIFYVAMTRAQEHLVLSGATDLERRDAPKPLCEPTA
jgi:ATP-dependent helicase/nuclease subunit A